MTNHASVSNASSMDDVVRLHGWLLSSVLTGLLLTLFLSTLDATIVGTALPKIVGDLHGFDQYSWVITAYLLTSTTVVPIVGKLSDQFGRKGFVLAGITLFLLGSALSGTAQNMIELILFRGLQGLGAGCMQTIVFTVVADIFPPVERGRWHGSHAFLSPCSHQCSSWRPGDCESWSVSLPCSDRGTGPVGRILLAYAYGHNYGAPGDHVEHDCSWWGCRHAPANLYTGRAKCHTFTTPGGWYWRDNLSAGDAMGSLIGTAVLGVIVTHSATSTRSTHLALAGRQALAMSLAHAFLVTFGVGGAIFLITFFLKDVRLRKRGEDMPTPARSAEMALLEVSKRHKK